jgi:hypothetical protein
MAIHEVPLRGHGHLCSGHGALERRLCAVYRGMLYAQRRVPLRYIQCVANSFMLAEAAVSCTVLVQ